MLHKNKRGALILIYILFLTSLVAAIWFTLIYRNAKEKSEQVSANKSDVDSLNSTPAVTENVFAEDKFYPMTLEYLQSREYSSEIKNIRQLEQSAEYTSYTVSYDSDGLNLNAYLTVPNSEAPDGGWPAIIFIHGYIPPTVYKTTKNYLSYVDYFASNGFVVLKPDLRGHDESEGEAYGAYYSGDYVVDTLNAYSALSSLEYINSEKVALWGHSMGGNIVFRSLVASKDISTAVIWAGAVYTYQDMQEFGIDDNSYRPPVDDSARQKYRQQLRDSHGSFSPDDPFWKLVPATNYLENKKFSLQINHAIDDKVVSIDYSKNLQNIIEKYNALDFELKTYKSGGHNIISPQFEEAMQNSLQFFQKKLF